MKTFESGWRYLMVSVLVSCAGCTLCPGQMYVKQGTTQDSARSDMVDCMQWASKQFSKLEREVMDQADRQREERRLVTSCMRERGYLAITEDMMGLEGARPASARSCSECAGRSHIE